MARLAILEYPDPRLRLRAEPVTNFDADVRQFADDMLETMYEASGIGLAATQVDVQKRLLVVDVSDKRDEPHVLVNPEIVESEGTFRSEEGCLSVPETYDFVERAQRIRVRAKDPEGNEFELEAEDLLAVCIQHEMDHLDGKLFVDYLSELKRQRIKKRHSKRAKRESGAGSPSPAGSAPAL